MSHTSRNGSHMITRATSQNGTRAATGKNAVTAALSSLATPTTRSKHATAQDTELRHTQERDTPR